MGRRISLGLVAGLLLVTAGAGLAASERFQVNSQEFAPLGTPLVKATWLEGVGCPTAARTAALNANGTAVEPGPDYTDPACATGDPSDKKVEGLLLSKTGPTSNFASAQAIIQNAPKVVTELGWDIRKPGTELSAGLRGSHCGAGAPRWNIQTTAGNYFIGCNSPPATNQLPGQGYVRLRWAASTLAFPGFVGGVPTALGDLEVTGLRIVFDEGYDSPPSNFGLAVLDNIDINGVLVGRGDT